MIEHRWGYCSLCEVDVVYCGKCGNNCCNGGYGTLGDGSECDACPSAYAQWDGNPKGQDPQGLGAKHDSPVGEADAP